MSKTRQSLFRFMRGKSTENMAVNSGSIHFLTYFLIMCFSIGSWVDISAIFSQIAVLMSSQPEHYELPSFLALIIQCGNICPIIYCVIRAKCPKLADERMCIFFILGMASIYLVVLGFTYDIIVILRGNKASSIPLFVLTFLLASADCLSTVTFFPYMSLFPPIYLSAYFMGQCLSGLIPSFLALIQNFQTIDIPCSQHDYYSLSCKSVCTNYTTKISGKHFSTRNFFFIIAAIMLWCFTSFCLLNTLRSISSRMVITYKTLVCEKVKKNANNSVDSRNYPGFFNKINYFVIKLKHHWNNSSLDTKLLLFCIAWVSVLSNGVLIQIMPHATRPYGALATHLTNNLYLAFQAITNIFLIWKRFTSRRIILLFVGLLSCVCTAIITMAVLARNGLVLSPTAGTTIVVLLYVLSGILVSCIRLTISSEISLLGPSPMFLLGMSTQIGAFTGTFALFFPVSVACVFSK